MIYGFNPGYVPDPIWIVMVNVLDQLNLGVGWPSDKNRTRICNRLRHRMKVILVLRGMPAAN